MNPIDRALQQPGSRSQTDPAPTGRDRRAQTRETVDATAFILLVKSGSRLEGRIVNLSLGGCGICLLEHFPLGIYTRAEIEFSLEGLTFRLGGVIQSIHNKRTVGIRFLDVSERKQMQIAELVTEIHAMRQAAEPAPDAETAPEANPIADPEPEPMADLAFGI